MSATSDDSPKVGMDDLAAGEALIRKLQGMLVCAIAIGTEFRFTYDFVKPATLQDLVKLERAIVLWVRDTCRIYFNLKPRQVPKLRLNLQAGKWVDDGDNSVTIALDFGKIFPGERPQKLIEEDPRHDEAARRRGGRGGELSTPRGLVVDLFAGGGGASVGIEAAIGRGVDIAINHSAEALAVHQVLAAGCGAVIAWSAR